MEWRVPAPESSEAFLKQAPDEAVDSYMSFMMAQLEQEVHELGSPDAMDQTAADGFEEGVLPPLLQLRPRTESTAPVMDDLKLSRPTMYLPEALEDWGDANGSYAADQHASITATAAAANRPVAERLTAEASQEQQHAKFSVVRSESTEFLETHAYTAPPGYDTSAACALDISYGRSGALFKGTASRAATLGGQRQAEPEPAAAVASPTGATTCTEGGSPIFSYNQLISRALSGDPTVTQSPTPATTQGGAPISVNTKAKDPSDGGHGAVAVQTAPRAVPYSSAGGSSLPSAAAAIAAPAPALAAKKPKASNAALKQKHRNMLGQHQGKYPPSAPASGGGFSVLADNPRVQPGDEARGRSLGGHSVSGSRGGAIDEEDVDQQFAGSLPYRSKYPSREDGLAGSEDALSSSMRTTMVSWPVGTCSDLLAASPGCVACPDFCKMVSWKHGLLAASCL